MPVAAEWEALSAFFGSSAIDQTLSCRLSPERVNDQSWQWRPPALQPARASTGAHAVFYRGRLLYFSLVTLTSVGYGDIVPLHPVAYSLVTLEALKGQLFPAILLARLVSLELEGRRPLR
jgi:voltage-gated potassium channel Kch